MGAATRAAASAAKKKVTKAKQRRPAAPGVHVQFDTPAAAAEPLAAASVVESPAVISVRERGASKKRAAPAAAAAAAVESGGEDAEDGGREALGFRSKRLSGKSPQQLDAEKRKNWRRGVVLICGLPRGFDEKALRNFLKQFGDITRIHAAKSKKTGGLKGHAFAEFSVREVAKIVAETLQGYILYSKTLKAELLAPEFVNSTTFKKARSTTAERRALVLRNERKRGEGTSANGLVRQVRRDLMLKKKLIELGLGSHPTVSVMPPISAEVQERCAQLEDAAKLETVTRRSTSRKELNDFKWQVRKERGQQKRARLEKVARVGEQLGGGPAGRQRMGLEA